MTVQSFLRGSLVLALITSAFGQTKPPAPVTPTPTPTSPTRPTNPFPSTTNNPNTMPDVNAIQRPILLIGKVLMDDGQPPPDSVTVQLVCRTSPRSIAYTDSKGGFSADLSSRTNSAVMMNATESWSGGMGNPGS